MIMETGIAEPWQGKKTERKAGCYHFKNVRFRLAHSSKVSRGWIFQPLGREARDFATWEEAVVALEETCAAIARHREERRNR
jgi:hypothetical protein